MAPATQSIRVFVALLALLFVVGQAAGQRNPGQAPDELRFNGNTGDRTQPSPVMPSQQISQLDGVDENALGQQYQQQQQPQPYRPIHPFGSGFLAPFDLFGNSRSDRGPFPLFDNLFDSIRRQASNIHHQFQNLERQAGEGQDVSYFKRDGVAYVRTCTTKKVSDNDQGLSVPFDRSNSKREQRGQEQQKLPVQPELSQTQLDLEEAPQLHQDKQSQPALQQEQQAQPLQQPAEQAP